MHHAVTSRIRRTGRTGGDGGFAIVLVALFLVFFVVVAAIVIDLGNARQQDREAVAAADAGALAGAQALSGGASMPSACGSPGDVSCLTAYYTLTSASIAPASGLMSGRGSCAVSGTGTCFQYVSGRATVEVTSPYLFQGQLDATLVHVKICWDANTAFASVIGRSSINVCGSATAQYTPAIPGGSTNPAADCAGEDNFLDQPTDAGNPTNFIMKESDYPANGAALNLAKAKTSVLPSEKDIVGAVFYGFDSNLDTTNLTATSTVLKFIAPTKAANSGPSGVSVQLGPANLTKGPKDASTKGITYSLQSLDASGKVRPYDPVLYPTHTVVIAYELPTNADLRLYEADGTTKIVYQATLHAQDLDQDHLPAKDCGNASFTFNADGSGGSTCIENSFLAVGVFPSGGTASPSPAPPGAPHLVGAYYTDESALQTDQYDPVSHIYGVDFEVTDPDGTKTQLTASAGTATKPGYFYTLTNLAKTDPQLNGHGDAFNTKVAWTLPTAATLTSGKYTIYLKMYDTDQNSGVGHDCGQASWSFVLSGGSAGSKGSVHLVE
jgi:hypothetical protein